MCYIGHYNVIYIICKWLALMQVVSAYCKLYVSLAMAFTSCKLSVPFVNLLCFMQMVCASCNRSLPLAISLLRVAYVLLLLQVDSPVSTLNLMHPDPLHFLRGLIIFTYLKQKAKSMKGLQFDVKINTKCKI